MQDLSQNIPYVPHAPLTNGVFLQQNQFLPKICGSLQICACDHNLLFTLFVYAMYLYLHGMIFGDLNADQLEFLT